MEGETMELRSQVVSDRCHPVGHELKFFRKTQYQVMIFRNGIYGNVPGLTAMVSEKISNSSSETGRPDG